MPHCHLTLSDCNEEIFKQEYNLITFTFLNYFFGK